MDVSKPRIDAWRNALPEDLKRAVPAPTKLDAETHDQFHELVETTARKDRRYAVRAITDSQNLRKLDRPRRLILLGCALQGMTPLERDQAAAEIADQQPLLNKDTAALLGAFAQRTIRQTFTPDLMEIINRASMEMIAQREYAREATSS